MDNILINKIYKNQFKRYKQCVYKLINSKTYSKNLLLTQVLSKIWKLIHNHIHRLCISLICYYLLLTLSTSIFIISEYITNFNIIYTNYPQYCRIVNNLINREKY